jgi:hypothetical protein
MKQADTIRMAHQPTRQDWPELPWAEWHDTAALLHRCTQIIGKIRLALSPPLNHWWHVTLYPTCCGLTTSPMPHGGRMVQIDFDFMNHQLIIQASDGPQERVPLRSMSVSTFYADVLAAMESLDMPVAIRPIPDEIPDPVPFDQDHQRRAYDPLYANRFWQILLQTTRVFTEFRGRFNGKVSPVHFFWGAMDLAVTRFSGRVAPKHGPVPNIADQVVQDAYSHEVSSCGFWPGGDSFPEPFFYSYAYPTPNGFSEFSVQPVGAYFHETFGEFILPYEVVRQSDDPDAMLLTFLQSTFDAAATLGKWDEENGFKTNLFYKR